MAPMAPMAEHIHQGLAGLVKFLRLCKNVTWLRLNFGAQDKRTQTEHFTTKLIEWLANIHLDEDDPSHIHPGIEVTIEPFDMPKLERLDLGFV